MKVVRKRTRFCFLVQLDYYIEQISGIQALHDMDTPFPISPRNPLERLEVAVREQLTR